jgi:hypothetical protein
LQSKKQEKEGAAEEKAAWWMVLVLWNPIKTAKMEMIRVI